MPADYAGDTAYKCFNTADFVSACSIPAAQVHKVPAAGKGEHGAAASAQVCMPKESCQGCTEPRNSAIRDLLLTHTQAYEDLIKSMSPAVTGKICA